MRQESIRSGSVQGSQGTGNKQRERRQEQAGEGTIAQSRLPDPNCPDFLKRSGDVT